MRISINSERLDNVLVVALDGRVDSANANEFQKMMEAEIVPEDKALIMDFEKATARIKDVLWGEIEKLRQQRKLLWEKMFIDAEKTLGELIAKKK